MDEGTNVDKFVLSVVEAIHDSETKISQCEQHVCEYRILRNRIASLHEKLGYDVMVPFGSVAFMPGRLSRTNEVMVLLGDNWFVECSNADAVAIIDRRLLYLTEKLSALKEERKLLDGRKAFSELLMPKEEPGVVEIKEPLDGSIEEQPKSREAHKSKIDLSCIGSKIPLTVAGNEVIEKRVDDLHPVTVCSEEERAPGPPAGVSCEEYKALMNRLDELEKLENEDENSDESSSSCDTHSPVLPTHASKNIDAQVDEELDDESGDCSASVREYKKVHWDDENIAVYASEAASDTLPRSSCDESVETAVSFSGPNVTVEAVDEEPSYSGLRRHSAPEVCYRKSILKPTDYKGPVNVPPEEDANLPAPRAVLPGSNKAFTGSIIERVPSGSAASVSRTSLSNPRLQASRAASSKFRQLRNLQAYL